MNRQNCLRLAVLLYCGTAAAQTQTPAPSQAALSLTVYQQDMAVVRDERTVELGLGAGELLIPDVSGQIVPGSTLVNGQGSLDVKAIHYLSANLTPAALLQRYIGRPVSIVRDNPQTGQESRQPAVLLGADGDRPIVKIGDRIEIGGPGAPWRIAFDELPDDLSGRDGLLLELENQVRGPQSLELIYLTRGLSWQADYVGVLDPQSRRLRLSGWASIGNQTDASYTAAHVQLLAGDINQASRQVPMYAMSRAESLAKDDLARQPSFDYHLYELDSPITLTPGQRTQVSLLGSRDVPVTREYRLRNHGFSPLSEPQMLKVAVRLKLDNDAPALGEPLPAGIVRIYAEGEKGPLQMLGEDRIEHTAVGEEVELELGSAFDITGERTQTSYRKIDEHAAEMGWRIELRNAKDTPVTVVVEEQQTGEWRLLESSQPPVQQPDANRLEWEVEVPAKGVQELTYRVETRY